MMYFNALFTSLLFVGTFFNTIIACGFESCHPTKDGYINVHIVPHSHDDVGWVKTVDQFFYGTHSNIYRAGVIYIYDSVLNALQRSTDRRFIYVESAFFWRWWLQQSTSERELLKQLVNNGQVEFTGGGWSMNDEAVTNYQSIIDQMSWGLKKLNDSFGDCGRPKIGWQIDPFGHSSEMASIFSQLGYDGVILGRIDYEDKKNRLSNKSMEMVWRGSRSLGSKSDIFTSILYNHYDAPAGFCFDILCDDDPLVDDPSSPEYNIEEKAIDFITNHVDPALWSFQTNNIIIPMGRDFAYQEAETWFKNIDRLIKYVNKVEIFNGKKYQLMYSTPSCYSAAVQRDSDGLLTSPLKEDDFFPYATDANAFWTGFYTSRPSLKRFERMGNNFLQICKQLSSITSIIDEDQLDSLRDAMGIMQHHDAITGTEREVVAYDYARILDIGIKNCEDVSSTALSSLIGVNGDSFQTCLLGNISQCSITENSRVLVVTIYNPLSREVNKYVRLPVNSTSFSVTDSEGVRMPIQIMPIPSTVLNLNGRTSDAKVELIFEAANLPPLGFKSYFVEVENGDKLTQEDLSLDFNYYNNLGNGFTIDPSTGLINQIRINEIAIDFDQRFYYYNGSNGWLDDFSSRASGAYLFRPDPYFPIQSVSDSATFEVYIGDIVTEIHQTFSGYVSQVVRLYNNLNYIEFEWLVGPLEIGSSWPDDHGMEVITRYSTPIQSGGTFYTDSNGREFIKRIRNFRPTWTVTVNETEASNYYPVTSKIAIRDSNMEFSVLIDRAEGGSSLTNGEIELMLLRNSILDDKLGVGEALTEMAYNRPIQVRGSHFVTLNPVNSAASIVNDIETQKLLDSWIFISQPTEQTFQDYHNVHLMKFSGLTSSLPKNVHILTLEPWTDGLLLRLEHTYEAGTDPTLSQPVTVDLESLFATFTIIDYKETTLGGNQWLVDSRRLDFKSIYQEDELNDENVTEGFNITLQPMQIRTFILFIKQKV